MIKGLFETHINVSSLERSMKFYGEVLGLELGRFEEERRVAFYWLGHRGKAMLGIWEKPETEILHQHFAFRCEVNDVVNLSIKYLRDRDLKFHNFLNDGTERPMVFAWMPAISIYFNDPDNHSLEFIAKLPGMPKPELGIISYEAWNSQKNNY